jgi:predicted transcriptional regulator
MNDPKEIKAEIRRLRKLKLQCRPGTTERLDLEHKIKDLKKQKAEITTVEPGKEKLIAEILRLEAEQSIKPTFEILGINLNKFTEKELQKHINRLKNKGIKND